SAVRARRTLEDALVRARAIASVEDQANILNLLAQLDQEEGDIASARRRFTESLGLFTQIKDAAKIKLLTEELATLTLVEQAAPRKAHPAPLASGAVLVTSVSANLVLRAVPRGSAGLDRTPFYRKSLGFLDPPLSG